MRRHAFAVLVVSLLGAAPAPEYDLLLRGGRIVDGSGNPWCVADVGVRAGRIAAVGRLDGARAARVIDARGLVVAPGFVDVHAHVESGIRRRPTADNFVLDGLDTAASMHPTSAGSSSVRGSPAPHHSPSRRDR